MTKNQILDAAIRSGESALLHGLNADVNLNEVAMALSRAYSDAPRKGETRRKWALIVLDGLHLAVNVRNAE
jgi:hypothetical protein